MSGIVAGDRICLKLKAEL